MRKKDGFLDTVGSFVLAKELDQKVDLGNSEPCNSLHQVLYIINFDSFGRNK